MEETKNLIYQTLNNMPKDLINIIMEFVNKYIYNKEHEILLNWRKRSDMEIYHNFSYFLSHELEEFKILKCCHISNNYLKNNVIDWPKNYDCICNGDYDILTIKNPNFYKYTRKLDSLKKLMTTNDFVIIQNNDWQIQKINNNDKIIGEIKYKDRIKKFINYDFYVYKDKVYLLNMFIKKLLIYDLNTFELLFTKIINTSKIKRFFRKKIRIVIHDDIIYVNNGKKLIILDLAANYISEINYGEEINLPFRVKDEKIYMLTKYKILIYSQK